MVNVWWTRMAVAVCGIALSLTTGVAAASADPDLGPLINTTCSYPQAMAALNAEDPGAAQSFSASPPAQAWLRTFLASPTDQRQRMVQQVQNLGALQQYVGVIQQVAGSCSSY
jgi:hemophore-related protein